MSLPSSPMRRRSAEAAAAANRDASLPSGCPTADRLSKTLRPWKVRSASTPATQQQPSSTDAQASFTAREEEDGVAADGGGGDGDDREVAGDDGEEEEDREWRLRRAICFQERGRENSEMLR